ncbi:MAG TPA: PTS sugar transporter subunit IIB [Solirubrobacteraceae bacterium]
MIRIATVCGMGFGTSMMLKLTIQQILRDEGIDAKVDPVDLGSFKTMPADVVVAPTDMGAQVSGTPARVVLIDNLIDKDEIRRKVVAVLRAEG